jgi:hypothetical protein
MIHPVGSPPSSASFPLASRLGAVVGSAPGCTGSCPRNSRNIPVSVMTLKFCPRKGTVILLLMP